MHDHERAAAAAGRSAVVRTPARTALDGPDDPFTTGLHARVADGSVPGPGVRCSAPTVLARELAAVHGVASAASASAVLGAGRAALDLRRPLEPSPATGAVVDLLRAHGVHGPGPDRHLSPEIEACVDLVRSGAVLAAATAVIGEMQ